MNDSTLLGEPEYDAYGRMRYHPELHPKQGTPWMNRDQKYLIENYEKLGPEDVSFALGRTIHTVMTRAYELRKRGEMPKPQTQTWHRRMRQAPQRPSSADRAPGDGP